MITKFLKKIKNFILDLIFPIKCLNCGKEGNYLCPDCLKSIPLTDKFICPGCRRPSKNGATCQECQNKIYLDGLIFALDYKNHLVKKAIIKSKYNFIKNLIYSLAKPLTKLINNTELYKTLNPDLVIPIPLHKRRLLYRGFNQSEILAKILCQKFSWPLTNNILKRIKSTRSQTNLSSQKRWENIKDAFRVTDSKLIKNKNVVLIDDVFTTGATLEEAAKTLKKAGAKTVWAITLAKD
ncbi:MAG: ComF family protein [Patescibacteria group bacterium]